MPTNDPSPKCSVPTKSNVTLRKSFRSMKKRISRSFRSRSKTPSVATDDGDIEPETDAPVEITAVEEAAVVDPKPQEDEKVEDAVAAADIPTAAAGDADVVAANETINEEEPATNEAALAETAEVETDAEAHITKEGECV